MDIQRKGSPCLNWYANLSLSLLVITRVFNAPRELVFKAWTEAKHVEQWFGPKGFTTRVTENDLRLGGQWYYIMIGPD